MLSQLDNAVKVVPATTTNRTPTFVLLGLCCLGTVLFVLAATIVLSLIPLYLPSKDAQSTAAPITAQTTTRPGVTIIPPGQDRFFVFDFLNANSGITSGAGGRLVAATATNFPALIGNNISMTVGYISACGLDLPHTNPRATEILIVMSGQFESGLYQENGARFIMQTLSAGQATVFPEGSIHFQQNLNCEPAMFIAGFNNADPGVQTIANNFFGGLPAEIAGASLGGLNITTVEDLKRLLPTNPALGIRLCRQKCGLK